ncbi:MAG: hypothetical protein FJ319_05440 [SAR202 cluster bacterium]|nr:hypothetical protein [SAR202 cluster bacterium]
MPLVTATHRGAPPAWALLERELISLMEKTARLTMEKYHERGGGFYWADCVDDYYEEFYNWGLFYGIGGSEDVLNLALDGWNATTRTCDDSIFHRKKHDKFYHGIAHRQWTPQIHNEYFNKRTLTYAGPAEWHHQSEANMAFYGFGLADPTISENVRRARRFAGMYIGEDPKAQNWDPKYRVIKSPIPTSEGPFWEADLGFVIRWMQGGTDKEYRWYGLRSDITPIVPDLGKGWWDDPKRAKEIVDLFNKIVLHSDSPMTLAATALVTNAYLYTGESNYKQWVLDYTEAWIDRMKANGGIVPDNVGPTGKIGEYRNGQWWGNLFGWNHYQGYNVMYHGLTIAAECAQLLTGDMGYSDLLRSQLKYLLDRSYREKDGQLIVPLRYNGKDGWTHYPGSGPQNLRPEELAHLYHMTLSQEDRDMVAFIRDGDVRVDWTQHANVHEKSQGQPERPRFEYYAGRNPGWPERALALDFKQALQSYEKARLEGRDAEQQIADNDGAPTAVFTKALEQVTMGTPQQVYNGGLTRATVRYFDAQRVRPGLPADVAALVDELGADKVGLQLVNTSVSSTRNLIIQAGAFGEHSFTDVTYASSGDRTGTPINGKYLSVSIPPATSIRLSLGMKRFVNTPSYAFPWHGGAVNAPFQ